MNVPLSLVREDVHARTVFRRAGLAFGFFLVFLAVSGFWPWFLEIYGYTLKGQHFTSRFLVLIVLLACTGYLYTHHRTAFENFCVGFFMYLAVFGGLTLFVPYRDDALDFYVEGHDSPYAAFLDFIPAGCLPHIDLNGVLQSSCALQSVNLLWFFVLGLPYAILGINGLGADLFNGIAFLIEERSPQLGFFYVFKSVPFAFVFFVGFQTWRRHSSFTALRWAGMILFLFFYHGYIGGGALLF